MEKMSGEFDADYGQQMDQFSAGMETTAKMIKCYYDSLIEQDLPLQLVEKMVRDYGIIFWNGVSGAMNNDT
jgi:hypothetical protein